MAALSLDALQERHVADAAAAAAGQRVADRRVATILRQLGWDSASEEPAESVAAGVPGIIGACVRGHRDVRKLYRDLAAHLRAHAHMLDGGGAPPSAWEPLAVALLDRYVA